MLDLDWQPDILEGYRQHVFELGPDPDGEGDAAAVLVRREPQVGERIHGAVLYVHGWTDYFFQTELADFFAARGLAFYALDLRKCGRARRPGQTAHYISEFELYDKELDLALAAVAEAHPGRPVLINAHSTGGLVTSLWLSRRRAARGSLAPVSGVLLNSPWFDLQGSPARRGVLTQALRVGAKAAPHRTISVPSSPYGSTLHAGGTGEWEFDLDLKPLQGFPVTVGWLNAVRRAHAVLHRGHDLGLPALILRSDRSLFSTRYSELSERSDLVLDVTQIARWSGCIGGETTIVPIPGARHDVVLSLPEVRKHAYEVMDDWLLRHPDVTGSAEEAEVVVAVEPVAAAEPVVVVVAAEAVAEEPEAAEEADADVAEEAPADVAAEETDAAATPDAAEVVAPATPEVEATATPAEAVATETDPETDPVADPKTSADRADD
jgi:alpha-beta hydrolase superfamily lysophospholipase